MPDTNILKGKGVYSSNDHNCKWPDEEKCIYIEESVSIQNSAKEMKDKKVSSLLVNYLLVIETVNPQV